MFPRSFITWNYLQFIFIRYFYRIHSLEEQLRELEIRSDDRIETEQQKFKEIMVSKTCIHCEKFVHLILPQCYTCVFNRGREEKKVLCKVIQKMSWKKLFLIIHIIYFFTYYLLLILKKQVCRTKNFSVSHWFSIHLCWFWGQRQNKP